MPAHPSSPQPHSRPHGRLGRLSSLLHPLRRDVQLEGGDILSHDIPPSDKSESLTLEVDHSPSPTDPGTLVNLAGRLRLSLPPSYRWFGPDDLKVIGAGPFDAGGFADLWVGEMDDRKVAVKSYRCYRSANCTPTYNVSSPRPSCTLCSLTAG